MFDPLLTTIILWTSSKTDQRVQLLRSLVCFWRCSQNHSFQQGIKQIIQLSINIWLTDIPKSNMHQNRLNSAVFRRTALFSLCRCILLFSTSYNYLTWIGNWNIYYWLPWFLKIFIIRIKSLVTWLLGLKTTEK